MKKTSYLTHYIILFLGMLILGLFFFLFRYNTPIQIFIGFIGCTFYAVWGILNQAMEERVTKLVVAEYVLFSLVSFLLMVLFVTI